MCIINGGRRRPRGSQLFSQSLPLLEQAIPFLIGKNGKSIQRITKLTDTQIHISETPVTSVGQTWRYATIRGELKNIARAKQLLVLPQPLVYYERRYRPRSEALTQSKRRPRTSEQHVTGDHAAVRVFVGAY